MNKFTIDLAEVAKQVGLDEGAFTRRAGQVFREPTDQEYEQFLRQNPQVLTTGRESLDLIIGIALIAFVFGFRDLLAGTETWQFVLALTAVISPAFILHELAHKYLAIHYGKYARFTLLRQMVMFTIIAGIIGLPLAGPGATMILSRSKSNESGIFAAGGPTTNFIIAAVSFGLALLIPSSISFASLGHSLQWVFYLSMYINGVLGLFNLIPFGALDGKKIVQWNSLVWILLILINIPMVYFSSPYVFAEF